MLHYTIITLFYLLIISFASSIPTPLPSKVHGLTTTLIPPLSPRSPFYSQILSVNNIEPTQTNITLNQTHFQKWILTKKPISQNDYSTVPYDKNTNFNIMELYIGKPAQLVYGLFDTGSDIIWLQCEGRVGQLGKIVTYYNQSKSSSYKVINCNDKINCQTKRGDMGCRKDDPSNNCIFEAGYLGGQSAKGVMSSDVTTLKPLWTEYQDFVFGCSNDNPIELPGIVELV
ncbi:hypothetical protein RND81_02G214100 [Saponaria officinalis]|uniref:Peptidase A1 domain-containing protein n=1 Tax=Saponaria officinalis TaxID=3572 RepID=A0AAW1MSX0_SAPOF